MSIDSEPAPGAGGPLAVVDVLVAGSRPHDDDVPVDAMVRIYEVSAADAARRARRCKGRYIALSRSAGAIPRDWLRASVGALRADPTLGAVTPGVADRFSLDVDPDLVVLRREALADTTTSGADEGSGLDLGWQLWSLGWRVRTIALARPADGSPAVEDGRPVPSLAAVERIAGRLLHDPGSLAPTGRLAARRRAGLQRKRRRPDVEIGALVAASDDPIATRVDEVLRRHGHDRLLGRSRRVIVATADTLAPTMAGPGIRAMRIAESLAADHDVVLVTTGACTLEHDAMPVRSVDDAAFIELVEWADVLIFQGWILASRPWISASDLILVADIYDPMHLEQLEQGHDAAAEGGRWHAVGGANRTLNEQIGRADYLLCASAKQRDFWLGQMASVGRVNPILYDEDDAFRSRLQIVPFGIDDDPPARTIPAIRGAVDGIGPGDEVVLWGGGIYNWFDPITLIDAVDRLRHRRPRLRLFFMGTRHPNPEIPEMRTAVDAVRRASELGILDRCVFFNDGWVPFGDRASYLLDADVAVSIHRLHVETEFSFRTRILDYLWCGLPVVATAGDSFAAHIERTGAGVVVPPDDVDALADALEGLFEDPARRAAVATASRALGEAFRWSDVLEPVRQICATGTRAPDVACGPVALGFGVPVAPPAWREDLTLARRYLSEGGVRLIVSRLRSRVRRLRSER